MSQLIRYIFLLLIFSVDPSNSHAQPNSKDSSYFQIFSKPNVFEVNTGIYSTSLNFKDRGDRKNDYRLVANTSAYAGIYLNYKWLSLDYSVAVPGTRRAKDIKLDYRAIGFNFSAGRFKFSPFYNSYNGLLVPKEQRGNFEAFRNIQYSNAGADLYYFTNPVKFSPGAASGFSAHQVKDAGAVFFMVTPIWQKINWTNPSRNSIEDSTTYTLLSSDPQWVSLIGRVGYTYNFTFNKGKWSIAPALLLGAGGLKELNTKKKNPQLVTDVQGWLSAGYNSANYYLYAKVWWDNFQTNLFIKSMTRINNDFSITAGYRFHNYKKKILYIL